MHKLLNLNRRLLGSRPVLVLLAALVFAPQAFSDAETAARLMPASTILYAEIPHPTDVVASVMDHPLFAQLEAHPAYEKARQTQQYRNYLTGRKFFEIQMGLPWREAVTAMTHHGIFAGFDPATNGFVVLVHGRDAQIMETVRVKLLELTRLGMPTDDSAKNSFEGVPVYRLQGNIGAAVVNDWFVATNQTELGKQVLGRLIASTKSAADKAPESDSLLGNEAFRKARAAQAAGLAAWSYVDLDTLRKDEKTRKNLENPAENPLAELLIGGIQSTLQHSPFATAALSLNSSEIAISFQTPWQADWIPEQRAYFFGTAAADDPTAGQAPRLPEIADTVLSLGTWRDVSEMWLRAGDLFDANMNDQLAAADSTLTTLFAGRDFGEDILGSFRPQIGFLVARQNFREITPQPAIRLPAFALILELREPERMTRELRRTFQSMVGFFNVLGSMEGRPQLEMDIEKLDGAELITSSYIPESDQRDSKSADIIFNFSPSVGFAGSRFVLSSTRQLAHDLSVAKIPEAGADKAKASNSFASLSAPVLKQVLADNREQLVSQNMLSEGNTRDEAETQIDLLLELLGYFRGAAVQLDQNGDSVSVRLSVTVDGAESTTTK